MSPSNNLHELSAEQTRNIMFWDVREFHLKFDCPTPEEPTPLSPESTELRKKLCREEFEEFMSALDSGNLSEIAAEGCDLIFVTLGTLVACGLPPGRFWRAICRANLAQEKDPGGGKVRKPQGWQKPDFEAILDSMGMRTIPKGASQCDSGTDRAPPFLSQLPS